MSLMPVLVYTTTACGLYALADLAEEHATKASKALQIVLAVSAATARSLR